MASSISAAPQGRSVACISGYEMKAAELSEQKSQSYSLDSTDVSGHISTLYEGVNNVCPGGSDMTTAKTSSEIKQAPSLSEKSLDLSNASRPPSYKPAATEQEEHSQQQQRHFYKHASRKHGENVATDARSTKGTSIISQRPGSLEHVEPQAYKFPSIAAELGFGFTLCMTQFLAEYLISGFALQLPLISEGNHNGGTSALWPAALLSLIMSAMLLIFARVSDMFGGYFPFMFGIVWLAIWTLIPACVDSMIVLDCARAMQGLALAAFMPSTFSILGKLYIPGRRKNVLIGIYSGFAPLGFFGGFMVAGALPARLSQCYWYIGAGLSCLTAVTAGTTIPMKRTNERSHGLKMDWLGSFLTVSGLILLSYALAVEPYADEASEVDGFATAIVLGPFIAGIACLVAAFYVEGWWADSPLLPLEFFKPRSVKPFALACMCFYACFGVWLYYSVDFLQNPVTTAQDLTHDTVVLAVWYVPMAILGLVCCIVGEPLLHFVPTTILLLVTALAWIAAPIFLAVTSLPLHYWSAVFPSMLCATIGINLTFTISIVFISSVQPPKYQGLCGAICSMLLGLAFAFSLPIAQIVMTKASGTNWIMSAPDDGSAYDDVKRHSLLLGFRSAFIYAAASAAAGFVICVLFVRMPRLAGSKKQSDEQTTELGDMSA